MMRAATTRWPTISSALRPGGAGASAAWPRKSCPVVRLEASAPGGEALELQHELAIALLPLDRHQLHRTHAGKISKASRLGSSAFSR